MGWVMAYRSKLKQKMMIITDTWGMVMRHWGTLLWFLVRMDGWRPPAIKNAFVSTPANTIEIRIIVSNEIQFHLRKFFNLKPILRDVNNYHISSVQRCHMTSETAILCRKLEQAVQREDYRLVNVDFYPLLTVSFSDVITDGHMEVGSIICLK